MRTRHEENKIVELSEQLSRLHIEQRNIERNIQNVERQLRNIERRDPEIICQRHIGRRCRVLNPNRDHPPFGTIVGFTRGRRPFVRIKEDGYVEIRRIAKNLQLLLEDNTESETTNREQ